MAKSESMQSSPKTYAEAGVDIDLKALAVKKIVSEVSRSRNFRKGKAGESVLGIGHFSGTVKVSGKTCIAITTDGVGTKVILAQQMKKFDTIGIDLVAMNVNDLLCIGAEPIAMVDYIAVEKPEPKTAEEIGKGLLKGAELANISIVGGELAVMPDLIKGIDLSGTAIGIVDRDKLITGEKIKPGDAVFGLESSGVHSNGLTLARKVLLSWHSLNDKIFRNGKKTVGEELLTPTKIYVREVLEIIKKCKVLGLANITGGGFGNLSRITKHKIKITSLPELPEVFKVIQKLGRVEEREMYRTFNMGIGFCIIAREDEGDKIINICKKFKTNAWKIGEVTKGKRGAEIAEKGIVLGY